MNEFLLALLNKIEKEMTALNYNGDTEVAHSIADQYLITIIKNLATDENHAQLIRIIEAYEAIDKWYV